MSDVSYSDPPKKRRWLMQFGTRTLFALVVLGALASWWARGEMLKEQRREELIADLQADGVAFFQSKSDASWRRQLAAWLRGQPPGPKVDTVYVDELDDVDKLQELSELLPEASIEVQATQNQDVPRLLRALARVKNLNHANLPSVSADDETIAGLGKIRAKGFLAFGAKRVGDELLRKLADAKVEVGSIWDHEKKGWERGWDRVTDEGLRAAAKFPKLSEVTAGPNASDKGLAAFNGHPSIHTVELTGPGYTDASAETLAKMVGLVHLTLLETRLTDAGIAKAIGNHPLQSLNLSKTQLGEESIAAIAKLTGLRSIELEDVSLSPELAAALVKLPIDYLGLRGDYTDADLTQLAPLAPTLQGVRLNTPNVTDEGLKWLSGAAILSSLRLGDTQATAKTMKIIATTSPQVSLELGGPNINGAVIAEAQRTFKTDRVWLYGDTIDDETLAALEPPARFSMLAGTRVTPTGLRSLKTNGKETAVNIRYAENTQPPLSPQEIEEIKRDTGGLVIVLQDSIPPDVFMRLLPRSWRKSPTEAKAP